MTRTFDSRGLSAWLAAAVLLAGVAVSGGPAFAKHHKPHKTPPANTDPCATPTAFVNGNIAKIKALQASLKAAPEHSVVGLFEEMEGTPAGDPETMRKIADLRRDTDGVNDLLRAGGCKTVDVDQQLSGK